MDVEPNNQSNDGIPPSLPENKYIDDLTIQLLLNKTNYAKYLSKTDTQKYEEHQQFVLDCEQYRNPILDMTKHMMRDPTLSYSSEVSDAFNQYARIIIRYLEVKERSDEQQKENGHGCSDEEEDVLFPSTMNEPPNPLRTKKPIPKKMGKRMTMEHFIPRTKDADDD
jgi:hypothetical protein